VIRTAKQTGYILLPVIVAITLVAAIALMMNTESALESNTASSELDAQQARYVAEAGLNHALWLTQQQGCGAYSDLTNEPLGSDKYSSKLTTDLGATTSYTVAVDQDSSIRDDNPTNGSPSNVGLRLRFKNGVIERPIYRYDLSAVVAKAPIISATAWFYVNLAHPEGPVDIHRITADWTETNANWNLLGSAMDPIVLASIPPQPAPGMWVSANLTSQVQAWVNGESNYGIMLNAALEGINSEYASRESANPPYLEVVVGTPPTSPAILKSTGTLQNGASRTITRNNVVLYQNPPGMRHLQPGALDGKDAEIWAQAPNNNYGTPAETWVSSKTNDTTRSLLQFNMGAIPAGARILGATLSLERQSGTGSNQPVSAHRISNDWSESSVTWNKRNAFTNWDTAGVDFDSTAVATTPVGPGNQRYEWDITPLVQGWVDGSYPNDGVVLVAAIPGMVGHRFYTSDDANPSRRPSLSVSYACACGTVCVGPQGGGGRIAMVGNYAGFSPDPRDLEKEAIIESWGYQVDQYDDNLIWLINFNNYDLVYISETTSSAAVVGQISWRSIGVVNEQSNLNPDLGFSTGNGFTTGDSVDIVDNSHYISAPFALGKLPIYSAQMEIVTGSPPASGLQTLAAAGGIASLMLLDTGAAGVNGAAPGRRVALPLGRATTSNFNWKFLNSNGRLIVQRAIEWGAGAGLITAPGPIAHWKLDETTGPTAVDSVGGHDGTLVGGTWTTGTLGGALDFNGSTDYVLVADDPALDITDAITLMAWFKPNKVATQYVFKKAISGSTDGYELALSTSGKVVFRLNQNSQGDTYRIDSTTSYPSDGSTWMHVAATYDGAVQRLYINGSEEVSNPALITIGTNNTALSIGAQADGIRLYDGTMDDVRIYNYALGPAEIAAAASGGGGPPPPTGSCSGTFRDEFNAVSYSGSDGTLTWAGDWLEVNESDGPTKNDERVFLDNSMSPPMPSYQLFVRDNDGGGEGVMRSLDLSGATIATLSFDYKPARLDNSGDYASVQMSNTGAGGPWSEVARIAGPANETAYQPFSADISAYISANSVLRIMTSPTMGGTDYVFFDNVQIQCQ